MKHHMGDYYNFMMLYYVTYDPGNYIVIFETFSSRLTYDMFIVRT